MLIGAEKSGGIKNSVPFGKILHPIMVLMSYEYVCFYNDNKGKVKKIIKPNQVTAC